MSDLQGGYKRGELTVHHDPDKLRRVSRALRGVGRQVALVPTMGALHAGHIELVRQAKVTGAVVIVSMATSCGADAPRGTEFLFNRNRLNVAISRAKCLAILVRGSRLLEVPGASKEDLPRLDLLARLDAVAAEVEA